MTDLEDIARRLNHIENKLDEVHAWMQRKLGAQDAEDRIAKRRAWVDRVAAGVVVGVVVAGMNWWLA